VRLGRSGRPQRITQGDALALPFPTASFDTIVTTFTLAGLPDGAKAVEEMARVLRTTGRIVMVDIGLPSDRNLFGILLARLWERIGDVLYDQAKLMRDAGLSVEISIEFGPGKHIRLIVARRSP
jgi:ubiquinone/menaquinone biosynthesis C-methylase UbiE